MKRDPTPTQALLDPAWAYESSPGFYDEVLGVENRVRPHWNELAGSLAALGTCGVGAALAGRPPPDPRQRHHLQRLQRPAEHVAPLAARSHSAGDGSGRVEGHRGRHHPAGDAVQRDPGGSVRSAAAAARRAAAGRAGVSESGISAALLGNRAAGRRLPAHLRGRSGALAGRAVVGARGPHAGAVGRGIRARKPAGDDARAAGRVPQRRTSAGWRISSRATATRCSAWCPGSARIRASCC